MRRDRKQKSVNGYPRPLPRSISAVPWSRTLRGQTASGKKSICHQLQIIAAVFSMPSLLQKNKQKKKQKTGFKSHLNTFKAVNEIINASRGCLRWVRGIKAGAAFIIIYVSPNVKCLFCSSILFIVRCHGFIVLCFSWWNTRFHGAHTRICIVWIVDELM